MEENNVITPHPSTTPEKVSGHLLYGIIGGLGAGLIGAVIWAVVTVLTKYQIGFMALGVGAFVGLAVRFFGEGNKLWFGISGALIALFSCVLGNFLSQIGFYSMEEGIDIFQVLITMDYSLIPQIVIETIQPMDFLFYGIAIYEGYRFALNKKTDMQKSPSSESGRVEPEYPRIKIIFLFIIFSVIAGIGVIFTFSSNRTQEYYYPSGKIQCRGKVSGGQAEGLWTYWYETGELQAEISFKHNKKDGLSKIYYKNGKLSGEEMYTKGLLHGPAKTYSQKGHILIEGIFQYDRRHGLFKEYSGNNVLISTGNYKLDELDGKWDYWYENGKKMKECENKNGDEYIINYWDTDGRLIVENGSGTLIIYYANGQKNQQGKIEEGMKTGLWKVWYENGLLWDESMYRDDEVLTLNYWDTDGNQLITDGDGLYVLYHPGGEKMIEASYTDGYIEGIYRIFYADGNLSAKMIYKKGKLDGQATYYYQNKNKSTQGVFKNGKRDGLWQWWQEDGTLSSEVTYVNGEKEGIQEFWVNEIKTKIEEYKNGELIQTKVF